MKETNQKVDSPIVTVSELKSRFETAFNLFDLISNGMGFGVLRNNYKLGLRGCFSLSILVSFIMSAINTTYIDRNSLETFFEDSSVFGFGLQSILKVYILLTKNTTLRSLFSRVREFYSQDDRSDNVMNQLSYYISSVLVGFKVIGVLYCGVAFMVLLTPIMVYVLFNERILMIGVKLPAIDFETTNGYAVHCVYHFVIIWMASLGLYAFDLVLVFMIVMAYPQKSCLEDDLGEVCKTVENIGVCDEIDIEEITSKMIAIIKAHKQIICYVNDIDDVFRSVFIMQVITSVYTIAVCILIILIGDWNQAYALVLVGLYQLLSFCFMGTLLELFNDDLTKLIYGCKWYLLPVKAQKLLILLLKSSQRAKLLSIMGVAPLNVATGLQILKTLYSGTMMMVNAMG